VENGGFPARNSYPDRRAAGLDAWEVDRWGLR